MENNSENEDQKVAIMDLEIDQLLGFFISICSTKAMQYMGFKIKHDKEPEKDLKKASLAIDCTCLMVEKIEPFVSGEEIKALQSMIADLKLNFVKVS
jgi:hypothetical protein